MTGKDTDTLLDALDDLGVKRHGPMKELVCDGEVA